MVFKSFKSFSLPYTINNFLFASLKLLTNLKMLTGTILIIAFFVIGQCSPVSTPHWMQGKCTKINLSLTASGMILQNQRRLPVCIFKCQNRCFGIFEELKELSKLVSNFIISKEQAKTLSLIISSTRKNFKNHQRMYTKCQFNIISLQHFGKQTHF
jgi:hypothetical protein